jgi:hypothetical protein
MTAFEYQPAPLHWATCRIFAARELIEHGRIEPALELLRDVCDRQAAARPLTNGDRASIDAIVQMKLPPANATKGSV